MPTSRRIERQIGTGRVGICFFILLYLIAYNLLGQSNKVLITDHVHFHSDYSDSEIQFDISQHFTNGEWTEDIRNQTVSLIGAMFNHADVSYHNNARFTYHHGNKSLNFKKIERDKADYFVRISSRFDIAAGQSFKSGGPNYTNYELEIFVRIENTEGKKNFRKTMRLPFQVRRPDELHDLSIARGDFISMYKDALNAIFTGQRRLKKRIVQNEGKAFHTRFVEESERFTLMHSPKNQALMGERHVNGIHELIDMQQKVLGSIKITGEAAQGEFTEAFGLNISNRLKQTGELQNSISEEKFTVVSGLNTNLDYEFETPASQFPRVVIMRGKDIVVKYEFLEPEKFVGDLAGEQYEAIINHQIGLVKLSHQNKMKGLIQLGPYIKEGKGNMPISFT